MAGCEALLAHSTPCKILLFNFRPFMSYLEILQRYWGYSSFRGIQEDIITSIGSGKDTLGLMPTGGGKSITFQVPALAQKGLCLVITPLIALMKDQVQNLKRRGIKATAIYSGMAQQEIIIALENCIYGNYKFLYISPERLSSELFLAKLRHIPVSFITVDESHCISQWGYDFRPAYLKIAEIRKQVPHAPILALTATATPEVVKDIQHRLNFKQENVFSMSFERKNLAYVVRHTENKEKELLHILQRVPGTAIVYTRSRNRTREIAELLIQNQITAEFYHAGLNNEEKDERQKRWQNDQSRVIVATNAFGMGIDKPNVRLVIHIDMPDSPEAYFQEAGRAGRDQQPAFAVLLTSPRDPQTLRQRISTTFPDKDFIRQIYEHLCFYYQIAIGGGAGETHEFDINKFCRYFKHYPVPTDSALRILTQAGYIEYTDAEDNASRLKFTIQRDEIYSLHEEPQSEELIRVLLRTYSGIFTDFAFIDEDLLARLTQTSHREVYTLLMSLSHRHIVLYIPQKRIPHIHYLRHREETERVVLSKEVYEQRKRNFEHRIKSMIEYATSTDKCRSRMLLQYFGELNDRNCLQCDVCKSKHAETGISAGLFNEVKERIKEKLARESSFFLSPFCEEMHPVCPQDKLITILRFLNANGEINIDGEVIKEGR